MTSIAALKAANARRWAGAKPVRNFAGVAARLVASAAKARYQTVERETGVPWFFIAMVHEREASQNWETQLGQGDPLSRVSVHIPRGRGPFKTWEDGAVDALGHCPPFAARNKDWTAAGVLTGLEEYNGLGYAARGVPSPYVWSGTNQYKSGKYVRDGVYDPNAVDSQPGCAGLLLAMMALDPTIRLDGRIASVTASAAPNSLPSSVRKTLPPSVRNPSKGSIGDFIASILSAIFKRKSP